MAQKCSVCKSPVCMDIDRALVSGDSIRGISTRFKISQSAVARHKLHHLPAALVAAQAAIKTEQTISVIKELHGFFDRAKQLLDACDHWLADPDHPGQYTIDPRAHEVGVVYLEPGLTGRPVRKKASLSSLLHQVSEERPNLEYVLIESKTSDPRKLLLEALTVLQGQLAMFIQIGDIADIQDRVLELERRLTNAHRIS